ncbi:unnamed protein product, partial [Vitis vinifera]
MHAPTLQLTERNLTIEPAIVSPDDYSIWICLWNPHKAFQIHPNPPKYFISKPPYLYLWRFHLEIRRTKRWAIARLFFGREWFCALLGWWEKGKERKEIDVLEY